jgi:hypothetical protein
MRATGRGRASGKRLATKGATMASCSGAPARKDGNDGCRTMTKPDEKLGLDPEFFAARMEKEIEAEIRCSFCSRFSTQTRRLVKSLNDGAVCDACVDKLVTEIADFHGAGTEGTCIFCERQAFEVHCMTKLSYAVTTICSDCIIGCVATLREYEDALREAGMVDKWDMGGVSPWDDIEN